MELEVLLQWAASKSPLVNKNLCFLFECFGLAELQSFDEQKWLTYFCNDFPCRQSLDLYYELREILKLLPSNSSTAPQAIPPIQVPIYSPVSPIGEELERIDQYPSVGAGIILISLHPISLSPQVFIRVNSKNRRSKFDIFKTKCTQESDSPLETAINAFSVKSTTVRDVTLLNAIRNTSIMMENTYGRYNIVLSLISNEALANEKDERWQMLHSMVGKNELRIMGKHYEISPILQDVFLSFQFNETVTKFYEEDIAKVFNNVLHTEMNSVKSEINHFYEKEFAFSLFKKIMRLDGVEHQTIMHIHDLVQLPTIPPKPMISIVDPNDVFYQEIFAVIPAKYRNNVKFIRRAGVDHRLQIWQNTFIEKYTGSLCKSPLFHGTPDTWRATAIAYHGFDLKIRLHGRASGDGAYSTENFDYAFQYSKSKGSVLVMKGIIGGTPNRAPLSGSPPIHVFPDTDCVVPYAIIDFGPIDENKCAYDKESQKEQEKYDRTMTQMKSRVEEFYKNVMERTSATYLDYLQKLTGWSEASQFGCTETITLQVLREVNQKKGNLPIYAHKTELVKSMMGAQVSVIGSDTGSGKSTQLPQYLMDDIINKSKKVIVLQPRRVNAEVLAERVASERGVILGKEVGWRVSHGCGIYSKNTSILFMTHRYFVDLLLQDFAAPDLTTLFGANVCSVCRNPSAFLANVGAIILDEAHESSLEIDLCFGLLNLILKEQTECEFHSTVDQIKMIVTSATINAPSFHKKLLGGIESQISSYVQPSLGSSSYPVHVEYRPLVNLEQSDLDQIGCATVSMSAAIQAVIELIRVTNKGNILVFVPRDIEALEGVQKTRQALDTTNEKEESLSAQIMNKTALGNLAQSKSPKRSIDVFAVFGDCNPAQKFALFNSKAAQKVIFATDVAETGITIDDVKYVIDLGYQQVSEWNNELGMEVKTTKRICQSSATQRKGRAGRVCPGYCLRLYSEGEYNAMIPPMTHEGKVKVNMERTVLFLHDLSVQSNGRIHINNFALPTSLSPCLIASAEQKLEQFGLLETSYETEMKKITALGTQANRLGIDIRLALFLITCCQLECGEIGVKIVAILLSGAEKHVVREWSKITGDSGMFSEDGDLFSVLKIYDEYIKRCFLGTRDQWIAGYNLAEHILLEVRAHARYLHKLLLANGYSCFDGSDSVKNVKKALSLCFWDQFCVKDVESGLFRRVIHKDRNQLAMGNLGFAGTLVQLASPYWDSNDGIYVFYSITQLEGQEDPQISGFTRFSRREFLRPHTQFCIVSAATHQECNKASKLFPNLCSDVRKDLTLSRLKSKFPNSDFTILDDDTLLVTATPSTLPIISDTLLKLHLQFTTTTSRSAYILLDNETEVDVAREFTDETETVELFKQRWISWIRRGNLGFVGVDLSITFVPSPPRIHLICSGAAKCNFFRIRDDLMGELAAKNITVSLHHSQNEFIEVSERMALLFTQDSLLGLPPRDRLLISVSRFLLKECGATIYGGFIRDWVIGNRDPSDIDCKIQVTYHSLLPKLKNFATTAGCTFKEVKNNKISSGGHLFVVQYISTQGTADIDIVQGVSSTKSAICDADVNNVQIRYEGNKPVIEQKIPVTEYSIDQTITNIRRSQFYCYSFQQSGSATYAANRAKKLISKGFTCIGGIGIGQLNLFSPKEKEAIIY